MKVVAFNGSPHPDGNTYLLIRHALKPLEAAGIETEVIQVGGRLIHGCTACFQCFKNTDGRCVLDADPVTGPTLIIHGTHDTIIPCSDAEALHQASGSARKQLLRIRGGGHNNLMATGFDEYFKAVAGLVRPGGMQPKAE